MVQVGNPQGNAYRYTIYWNSTGNYPDHKSAYIVYISCCTIAGTYNQIQSGLEYPWTLDLNVGIVHEAFPTSDRDLYMYPQPRL